MGKAGVGRKSPLRYTRTREGDDMINAGVGRKSPLRYTPPLAFPPQTRAGVGRKSPLRYTSAELGNLEHALGLEENRRSGILLGIVNPPSAALGLEENRRSGILAGEHIEREQ